MERQEKAAEVAQLFIPDNVRRQVQAEIARVFAGFDKDGSGHIDTKKELPRLLESLCARGFVFGEHAPGSGYDDATSVYMATRPKLGRFLVRKGLEHDHEQYADDTITIDEFSIWLQGEVFKRKTNLRIVLNKLDFTDEALEKVFSMADTSGDGQVSRQELEDFVVEFAGVLGEPPPAEHDIDKMMLKADTSADGQLSYTEFRYVVVEAMTRLFHAHFNTSMNVHRRDVG